MDEKKIKLDLGCGKHKKEGFIGIDIDPDSDADIVISALTLPFEGDTVDEISSRHLVEHFSPEEAKTFFAEIYRVLKRGGQAGLKVDRDWTRRKLLNKDKTHKHRYSAQEIRDLTKNFSFAEVKNKIYLLNLYTLRNKIFVCLKK